MILFHQRGKAQKSFNKTKEISTYTLPDDNGTLAIAGNIGSTAIIALVEKPSILYPSNGSSEYNNSITISQYVNNYLYTGTKTHTTIQVSTDSNFNNIVVNNFIPDTNTNARDISLPLDYSNTTLYIRIRYHSGDYCSMWSEIVSVRTKTFTVSIPTILTPSSSLEATPVNLLITTGNFNYIGVSDTHYSTHYQVSTNEAFTSLYYNVESTTSLNSAATTLEEGDTYYIRVRYRGTKYGYSDWSNVVKISTLVPYVHVPTILTPSNNSTNLDKNITIVSNAFKFTGVSDAHYSTHYQVSTNVDMTSLVYNEEIVGNQLNHTIPLQEGTTYYIRVRHNGKKYGSSNWSSTFKVSTLVPITLLMTSVSATQSFPKNHPRAALYLTLKNDGTTTIFVNVTGNEPQQNGPRAFVNATGQQLYYKYSGSNDSDLLPLKSISVAVIKSASDMFAHNSSKYDIYNNSKTYLFTIELSVSMYRH